LLAAQPAQHRRRHQYFLMGAFATGFSGLRMALVYGTTAAS